MYINRWNEYCVKSILRTAPIALQEAKRLKPLGKRERGCLVTRFVIHAKAVLYFLVRPTCSQTLTTRTTRMLPLFCHQALPLRLRKRLVTAFRMLRTSSGMLVLTRTVRLRSPANGRSCIIVGIILLQVKSN